MARKSGRAALALTQAQAAMLKELAGSSMQKLGLQNPLPLLTHSHKRGARI